METVDYSFLQALWFILIAVLWIGFFVLEGFDFGVGMLMRTVARTKGERRAVLHTIGPMWDGNEVWLLTAGGATFAAFPFWYATMFSGFYLALFLVLLALIVRGVSFEFWGKNDDSRWRSTWEWAMVVSCGLAALLFGVAFANIVRGVPIDAEQNFTGDLFTLLNPYGLLGGVTTLLLFLTHGAFFLELRTEGEVRARAAGVGRLVAPLTALAGVAFLVWTVANMADASAAEIAVAVLAGLVFVALGTLGAARAASGSPVSFGISTASIALLFTAIFVDLFPNVMPSSTSPAFDLTIANTSSSETTLTIMAIVAAVMVPIVLAYTAWSYWVFRRRVSVEEFDLQTKNPIDLMRGTLPGGDAGTTAG